MNNGSLCHRNLYQTGDASACVILQIQTIPIQARFCPLPSHPHLHPSLKYIRCGENHRCSTLYILVIFVTHLFSPTCGSQDPDCDAILMQRLTSQLAVMKLARDTVQAKQELTYWLLGNMISCTTMLFVDCPIWSLHVGCICNRMSASAGFNASFDVDGLKSLLCCDRPQTIWTIHARFSYGPYRWYLMFVTDVSPAKPDM